MRVGLVACAAKKRQEETYAWNLYDSPLFDGSWLHARQNCDHALILSAKHGLLSGQSWVAPYDLTLAQLSRDECRQWATTVVAALRGYLAGATESDEPITVVFYAGERYRRDLVPECARLGWTVEIPMAGLRIGEQLHWLKAHVPVPSTKGARY